MKKFTKSDLGRVIDCSCQSADNLNIRTIRAAQRCGMPVDDELENILQRHVDGEPAEDDGQKLSDAGDEAVGWLNQQEAPPYCSFYFEDNSLFFSPSVESARDDVGFISKKTVDAETDPDDASYPAKDYRGEWLHVSDHGNATLYLRGEDGNDVELWSVV